MQVVWSDQMGSRRRRAWLLLVDTMAGRVYRFAGQSIQGVVVVVGSDYQKAGWHSHTTYRLALYPGVRALPGREGWETGTFREGLRDAVRWPRPIDRWGDVANALGVSLGEAQRFLREWLPNEAADLDRVEAELAALDEATAERGGAEIVAISFGSPMRREIDAGFWTWPVMVFGNDGQEVGRVVPGEPGGWDNPQTIGPIRIVGLERGPGHGGGWVSLRLAVPVGCRARHGQP